ncbi:hypothetical protein BHU61_09145 [Macrococcus epidermidis]|uniref:Uncharacterized protein n=1 Tax=Macrococcus epidermidis TaxID=1902580 RepID=A0A327ZQ00_9STAP|nr:hypothetical protein [Macrococcus epidermidis]RAK44319.1 hypothetical protein BHU61_09145 [Macrococcus epidermidis]
MSSLYQKNIKYFINEKRTNFINAEKIKLLFVKHISDIGIELNQDSMYFVTNSDDGEKIILLNESLKYVYSLNNENGSIEVSKGNLIGVNASPIKYQTNVIDDTLNYKYEQLQLIFDNEKLNFEINLTKDEYKGDKDELYSQLLNLIK